MVITQVSMPNDLVRFDGRILFLSQDPRIIERQLRGEAVSLERAVPLRTDVSTAKITRASICYYFVRAGGLQ